MSSSRIGSVVALAAAIVLNVTPAGAAAVTQESSPSSAFTSARWSEVRDETPQVYVGRDGRVIPQDAEGNPLDNPNGYGLADASRAALSAGIGPCTPDSGRDNPHRSSTGFAASGHGWWNKGDCSNNLADVYNCLYMKHVSDGYWYQKDCSPVERLKPGGGSSYRTTARRDCATSEVRQWRNHVDVDVVDEWDSGENPMREAPVACRT